MHRLFVDDCMVQVGGMGFSRVRIMALEASPTAVAGPRLSLQQLRRRSTTELHSIAVVIYVTDALRLSTVQ